jgi:hypothetical protein
MNTNVMLILGYVKLDHALQKNIFVMGIKIVQMEVMNMIVLKTYVKQMKYIVLLENVFINQR